MPTALFVRALAALAAGLLLAGTLTAAGQSAAAGPSTTVAIAKAAARPGCAPKCWAAISFNTATGYSGWRRDTSTKAAAMRGALISCRERRENRLRQRACQHPDKRDVYTVSGKDSGCVAVAFRRNGGRIVEWAKGVARTEDVAMRKARRQVRGMGTITVSRWTCAWRGPL